jgi:hypothetical protein
MEIECCMASDSQTHSEGGGGSYIDIWGRDMHAFRAEYVLGPDWHLASYERTTMASLFGDFRGGTVQRGSLAS